MEDSNGLNLAIFSSDEEDIVEMNKKTKLSIEQSTVSMTPLSPNRKVPRISSKISPLKFQQEMESDTLTKSPKRFTRIVENMKEIPRSRSSSPTPRKNEKGRARKRIISDDDSSVITIQKSIDQTFSPSNNKSTNKVSPHKTTPREKDAWKDLFTSLGEGTLPTKKLDLISKLNHDLEEIIDTETKDSDEKLYDTPLAVSIDFSHLYSPEMASRETSVDTLNTEISNELSPTKRKRPNKFKTYGDQRSYLEDRDDDNRLIYEETFVESNTKDVHDLKALGKLNRINDDLEYFLEGLKILKVTPIEKNQSLINCLVDLAIDVIQGSKELIWRFESKNVEIVLDRVCKIWTRLERLKSDDGNGKNLIESLIIVVVHSLQTEEQHEIPSQLISKISNRIDQPLFLNYQNVSLSDISKQNLKRLKEMLKDELIEKNKMGLDLVCSRDKTNEDVYMISKQIVLTSICKYVTKFENNIDGIEQLSKLLSGSSMERIIENMIENNDVNNEEEEEEMVKDVLVRICQPTKGVNYLNILQYLVIISTLIGRIEADMDEEFINKIMNQPVLSNVLELNMDNCTDSWKNLILLGLGYELNVVEFNHKFIDIGSFEALYSQLPISTQDIDIHLKGYYALIVAIMLEKGLKINLEKSRLKEMLEMFSNKANEIGTNEIQSKIIKVKSHLEEKI
ncbi:hypothetical protein CAAN3_01S14576 [[Candida] anglica]